MSTAKKTVKILPQLSDRVDLLVKVGAYSSRANFVEDAVRRRLEELKEKEDLTDEEKRMLDAWTRHRSDLRHVDEDDLRELLLADNGHVWPWLRSKLDYCVEYIFKLRSNRN